MPFSLNRVELIGRLGAEAEISETRTGNQMAKFRLAVTETWKDREGRQQERTEWVNVLIFGEIARSMRRVPKGGRIAITGRLQTDEVTDREGNKRWFTSVVVSDPGGIVFIDFDNNGRDERRGRDDSRSGGRDDHRAAPPPRREDRGPPGRGAAGPPAHDRRPPPDDDIPF